MKKKAHNKNSYTIKSVWKCKYKISHRRVLIFSHIEIKAYANAGKNLFVCSNFTSLL